MVAPDPSRRPPGTVSLRPVADADVEVFFDYQFEAGASEMAAFPPRGRDEHRAHWSKIRAHPTGALRTIIVDGQVAGNVVSWRDDSRLLVGYWVGKAFWGKGVATAALRQFVAELGERPLHAYVAAHNVGSIRVLEKCGFVIVHHSEGDGDVEEFLMELPADG